MFTHLKRIALLIACITLIVPMLIAGAQTDAAAQPIIEMVVKSDLFAEWLINYPDYRVDAYGPDEFGNWYVEFHDASSDEWLGYATVSAATLEIVDGFAPIPLAPEVYQQQLAFLLDYVLSDPEVLAWLDEQPSRWTPYPDWNRWEQVWQVYFHRGIEAVIVNATVDEYGSVWIAGIFDPNVLEAQAAFDQVRDQAITLAYSADGIDTALDGFDDWRTLVEPQGDDRWSVSFISDGRLLFFALVDTARNRVLSSEAAR